MSKNKTEEALDKMADELFDCLKNEDASISISKANKGMDLDVEVKATPFQAAFMSSAIGYSNRKIAAGMFGGLLCALFHGHEEFEDEMTAVLKGLMPVLSDDEIDILGEAAIASHIMRKIIENDGRIIKENKVIKDGKVSDCFASTGNKTIQ